MNAEEYRLLGLVAGLLEPGAAGVDLVSVLLHAPVVGVTDFGQMSGISEDSVRYEGTFVAVDKAAGGATIARWPPYCSADRAHQHGLGLGCGGEP